MNTWIGYLFLLMLVLYTFTYLLFGIVWFILHETTANCVKFPKEDHDGFLAAYMFSLETQVRSMLLPARSRGALTLRQRSRNL